jgi:D-alanyl-lipoteichoic acid acyltransferase DltB (MBOAT superfamily)
MVAGLVTFTSLAFYAWLAAAVVLFRLVPPKLRAGVLVVVSCAFCGAASPAALALLAGATVIAFFAGRALADQKNETTRSIVMYVAITLLVGALVAFKIAGVVSGVLIPLGLSYYTFKLTSYVVETYWDPKEVQRSFVSLAAYATFGAQLVSGPIQRPATFFEQLAEPKLSAIDFERAFGLVLHGLFLKLVIGDRLGTFTAMIAKSPDTYSRPVLAFGALTYLPQLYADFAGYTNIALGIGLLFGIEGPPNFDAPFAASNLQDYWRRWHMSLTTWLGDYVFTPLRMATRTWGKAGLVASVVVNMTLIGVWHGFTWCFLVFGVMNGIFLSVSVLTLKQRAAFFDRFRWLTPFRVVFGIVIVQLLIASTQIFFNAPSIESALSFVKILVGLKGAGASKLSDIRTDVSDPLLACWIVALYAGLGMPGTKWLRNGIKRFVPNWIRYGVTLLAIAALTLEAGGRFIYGQF